LELLGWGKNLQQKDRRPLWMLFETFERTAASVSECDLVWCTADSCRWGVLWMETMFLSLYSCKGTPFWILVVIPFSHCMAEQHFMICYLHCFSYWYCLTGINLCKMYNGQISQRKSKERCLCTGVSEILCMFSESSKTFFCRSCCIFTYCL